MTNLAKHTLFLLLLVPHFQIPSQDASQTEAFHREIEIQSEQARPVDRAARILIVAELRGGVEEATETCAMADSPQAFASFHGNVDSALQSVNATGGQYRWRQEKGAVLVQRIAGQSLLDTRISRFAFDPDQNPLMIEDALFSLPEVRARVKELNLIHRDSEIGFSQAPSPRNPTSRTVLENLTMREALLVISATHKHNLLWTYQQYSCDKKNYSAFSWRVR